MAKAGWSGLGRPLKSLFIVSLALNLAILGAVGGWAYKWHRHGGPWHGHGGGLERQLFRFSHSLPWERRRELRQYFRTRWKDMSPKLKGSKEVRERAAAALEASPYNRDQMGKALGLSHEKRVQMRGDFEQLFLDVIDKLTAEERKAFAAELRKERKWRKNRWRHGGEP